MMYTCACPAQVCKSIQEQRALYKYQEECLDQDDVDRAVHSAIMNTVAQTHALLEDCLEEVLKLEGWDMQNYTMPESLVQRMLQKMDQDA